MRRDEANQSGRLELVVPRIRLILQQEAYESIKQGLGVRFVPELTHEDVCETCVKEEFPGNRLRISQ